MKVSEHLADTCMCSNNCLEWIHNLQALQLLLELWGSCSSILPLSWYALIVYKQWSDKKRKYKCQNTKSYTIFCCTEESREVEW